MEERPRRKLFEKERFLEGNRQKWLVVFLAFGLLVLITDALNVLKDPTPYLTFLTFCAGSFILGYSGTETMKLFRADSTTVNQNINEDRNENSYIKKDINVKEERLTNNAKEEDYNIQEINA
jgi:hypothetical protein